MSTVKFETYMPPVMIERKPGLYVIPLWDRRLRGLRTIRLLANAYKIGMMIMVNLEGEKRFTIFEQDVEQ